MEEVSYRNEINKRIKNMKERCTDIRNVDKMNDEIIDIIKT